MTGLKKRMVALLASALLAGGAAFVGLAGVQVIDAPQAYANQARVIIPYAVQDCMNLAVAQTGYSYTTSPLGCLWRDINYGGTRYVEARNQKINGWAYYTNLVHWNGGSINDLVSALYNNTSSSQYYYRDANEKGGSIAFGPFNWVSDLRQYAASWGNWNDQISSIMVYNTPW